MSAAALLIIIAGSLLAGFIQSVSGFGAGVIMTLLLTQFFDPVAAVALNVSVCTVMTLYLIVQFRKYIQWRLIVLPLIPYLIVSTLINKVMTGLDVKMLGVLFGVFQIILAVYYLFFAAVVKPRKDAGTAIAIGGISGATASLFGVGGPFLSLYMVAVSSSPKSYTANLQCVFVISNIVILSEKLAAGHYPVSAWYFTVAGALAIVAGARLGIKLLNKLDSEKMKRVVYWFLLASGITTVLQNVLTVR